MDSFENAIEHDKEIFVQKKKRIEALKEQAQSLLAGLDYELSELDSILSNFDKSLSRIEKYSCKTSG